VYLGTPYGVSVAGTTYCYLVEVLGAPVKGAVADHCSGEAYDEDACFSN
jgi:heme A synthase